jgi:predicted aspartyl protease
VPLHFEDNRPFAQGACPFLYRPATAWETTPRLIITTQIEGIQTEVVIDTGGVYLVCNPAIMEQINFDPSDELGTDVINIRGHKVTGVLHRLSITLLAEEGQSLELEALSFVPHLRPTEEWDLPSFMGMFGCLERLRFAVDPVTNTFYFGTIDVDE